MHISFASFIGFWSISFVYVEGNCVNLYRLRNSWWVIIVDFVFAVKSLTDSWWLSSVMINTFESSLLKWIDESLSVRCLNVFSQCLSELCYGHLDVYSIDATHQLDCDQLTLNLYKLSFVVSFDSLFSCAFRLCFCLYASKCSQILL